MAFFEGVSRQELPGLYVQIVESVGFLASKNFGANLTLNVVSRGFSWEIVFLAKGTQRYLFWQENSDMFKIFQLTKYASFLSHYDCMLSF